jgi:hypothetical protein
MDPFSDEFRPPIDPPPTPANDAIHPPGPLEEGPQPIPSDPSRFPSEGDSGIQLEPPRLPAPPTHTAFWVFLLVGAILYVGMWIVGGEAAKIATAGLEVLPFLVLAVLASVGLHQLWARVLTVIWWVVVIGGMALLVWLLVILAGIEPGAFKAMKEHSEAHRPPSQLFTPGAGADILRTFLGLALAAPLGLIGYAPTVRKACSRVLPFDADSFVHATALATVIGVTAICFVPLIILGQPPLLVIVNHFKEDFSKAENLRDQLYGLIWLVPAAILAAGYPLRRSLGETLKRVGLVVPRVWQVVFAVLASGLLVLLMTGFDEYIVGWLWKHLGWPTTDGKAFNELMKFAINPLGAVVIGITAGLGEELAVRGVLQPRLGILLSNLFFTSLHALQYNFDGLLSVFVIGLILGLIRKFTNTTTSALVHGLYDCALVLLTYYEVEGFS